MKHNHEVTPNSRPLRSMRKQRKKMVLVKPKIEPNVMDNHLQASPIEISKKVLPLICEDEYEPAFSQDGVSPHQLHPQPWVEVRGILRPDIPPLLHSPINPNLCPSTANKPTFSPVVLSQIQTTLQNLKNLALSSDGFRYVACMQELLYLETKWRREFTDSDDGIPLPLTVPSFEVPCSSNSPFIADAEIELPTSSTTPSFQHHQRRRKRPYNQIKTPTCLFSSSNFDIDQSGMFDSSAAELIARPSWFYD